jgi:hypothetical protein
MTVRDAVREVEPIEPQLSPAVGIAFAIHPHDMTQTMEPSAPPSGHIPSGPIEEPRAATHGRARRWPRRVLIGVLVLLALAVIVRLVLDPIAAHYTRKALDDAKGMQSRFEGVHVTVFPPGYEIRDLAVIEVPGGTWKRPLFEVERARVSVDWRGLLQRHVAVALRLDEPKIKVTQRSEAPTEVKEQVEKHKPRAASDVANKLQALMPARVERVEVRRGEFSFRDIGAAGHPEVALHRIEAVVENLATRPTLDKGRPTTASLSAVLGKSGDLSVFVSSDLFAKSVNLAGNAALRGWKVAELYELEKARTQLKTPQGTLDMFTEFKVRNGNITGGVKPVLKNVEVEPADEDLFTKIKAWLADQALDLFSDRVPGREAVATVVPIRGHLDDPDVQLIPTVLSILRNAFVQGISAGFSHLPPPISKDKDGLLGQASDALQKDKGPAPAQPEKESDE